jgi:hypothetical protein
MEGRWPPHSPRLAPTLASALGLGLACEGEGLHCFAGGEGGEGRAKKTKHKALLRGHTCVQETRRAKKKGCRTFALSRADDMVRMWLCRGLLDGATQFEGGCWLGGAGWGAHVVSLQLYRFMGLRKREWRWLVGRSSVRACVCLGLGRGRRERRTGGVVVDVDVASQDHAPSSRHHGCSAFQKSWGIGAGPEGRSTPLR